MTVRDCDGQVVHYQFLQWPDHDVPQTPFSFALMVQDISIWQRSGPIIVHCRLVCLSLSLCYVSV